MRLYQYPALVERGDEQGFVVTFRDVPEAVTQGYDLGDARQMAVEALGLALLTYPMRARLLPTASAVQAGEALIGIAPDVAAKLAVLEAFRTSGMTKSGFAQKLGKDEKEVRRILDPMHPTKLPTLAAALHVLGQRLIVGVVAA
jgi:antitoxin HicB